MDEKDDKKPKPWEQAIAPSDMRQHSRNWSLSNDASLLLYLQEFSQKLTQKTHDMDKFLDNLVADVKVAGILVSNVINDFHMLSNNQFIENRVYDEKEQDLPEIKPPEKTKEEQEKELIPRIQQALEHSRKMVENNFDTHHQSPESDSESEDKESLQPLKGETILEPKSTFLARPMPYIIGSTKFHQDDYMGMASLLTDEEEFEEEEEEQETKSSFPNSAELNHRLSSSESESEAEEARPFDSYSKSSESLFEEPQKKEPPKENEDLFKPAATYEEEDEFSPFSNKEGLFARKEENGSRDLFFNSKPIFASTEPPKMEEVESKSNAGGLFDSDGEEDLFGPPVSSRSNAAKETTGDQAKPLGSLAAEIGASLQKKKNAAAATEQGSGASTPSVGHKPGGSSSQSSNSLFTEEQDEQVEIAKPKKTNLFDDDDDADDDLFFRPPTSRKNTTISFTSDVLPPETAPQQAKTPKVEKTKTQDKRPSLFDNDGEEDDLFNASRKPSSAKESPGTKKLAGGIQLFGGLNPLEGKKLLSPRKESTSSDIKEISPPPVKPSEKPKETKSSLFDSGDGFDLGVKPTTSPLLKQAEKPKEKKGGLFDDDDFDLAADLGSTLGNKPKPKEKKSSLFDSDEFEKPIKPTSTPLSTEKPKDKKKQSLFDSGEFDIGSTPTLSKTPSEQQSSLFDSGNFSTPSASVKVAEKPKEQITDKSVSSNKPLPKPKESKSSLFDDSDDFGAPSPLFKSQEKPSKLGKSSLFDDSDDFGDALFSSTPSVKKKEESKPQPSTTTPLPKPAKELPPEFDIFADIPKPASKPKKPLDFSLDDDEEDDIFSKPKSKKTEPSDIFSSNLKNQKEDLFAKPKSSKPTQLKPEPNLFTDSLTSKQDHSKSKPEEAISAGAQSQVPAETMDSPSTDSPDIYEDTKTELTPTKKNDIKKQLENILSRPMERKPKDATSGTTSTTTESPTSAESFSPTSPSKPELPPAEPKEQEKIQDNPLEVGFDKPADTNCQLEVTGKSRVHGHRSRRPPTRKGRQAALLPTSPSTEEEDLFSPLTPPQEDFPDSKALFQSTPIHDTTASLFVSTSIDNISKEAEEKPVDEPSKTSFQPIPPKDEDIFHDTSERNDSKIEDKQILKDSFNTPHQDLFAPPEIKSTPKIPSAESNRKKTNMVFLDDEDDEEEDIFTPKVTPSKMAEPKPKPSSKLFDNEEDIFSSSKPIAINPSVALMKEAPPPLNDTPKQQEKKSSKSVKSVFDDDDDDDIFCKLPSKPKKTTATVPNKFLFDDNLGDIFSDMPSTPSTASSSQSTTPGATQSRRRSSSAASTTQKTLSVVTAADDPLRHLGDS